MTVIRRGVASLEALALQVITLANSTAIALNSTSRGADVLHFSVETNDVRYRTDATAPTKTTGVLIQSDTDSWFWSYNGTSLFRFQRTTGTCKVTVQPYRYEAE